MQNLDSSLFFGSRGDGSSSSRGSVNKSTGSGSRRPVAPLRGTQGGTSDMEAENEDSQNAREKEVKSSDVDTSIPETSGGGGGGGEGFELDIDEIAIQFDNGSRRQRADITMRTEPQSDFAVPAQRKRVQFRGATNDDDDVQMENVPEGKYANAGLGGLPSTLSRDKQLDREQQRADAGKAISRKRARETPLRMFGSEAMGDDDSFVSAGISNDEADDQPGRKRGKIDTKGIDMSAGAQGSLYFNARIGKDARDKKAVVSDYDRPPSGPRAVSSSSDVWDLSRFLTAPRILRQIHSRGRGDSPAAFQSPVVQNATCDKGIFNERARVMSQNMLVPGSLKDRVDFAIYKGDWLFKLRGQKARRTTRPEMSNTKVFSSVNGLPANAPIMWHGQASTDLPVDKLEKVNTVLATYLQTTMTGVHTGPGAISVGGVVAFSQRPLTIETTDGKGTQTVPAVVIRGTPETRLVPATYEMRHTSVGESAARINAEIEHEVDSALTAAWTDGKAKAVDFYKKALNDTTNALAKFFDVNSWGLDVQPMHMYARWYVITRLLAADCVQFAENRNANTSQEAKMFEEIAKFAERTWVEQKQVEARQLGNMYDLTPTQSEASNKQLAVLQTTEIKASGNSLSNARMRSKWVSEVLRIAELQKVVAQEEQAAYNRCHVMGIAIEGAPGPGSPFDLFGSQFNI